MKRALYLAVGLVFATSALAAQGTGAAGKKTVKAEHAVKLGDPAGDVKPVSSSEGKEYPGLDVVEFALASDGAELSVNATLKNKIEKLADTTVELLIDTDNNLKTGGKSMFLPVGGFERQVNLNACLEYTDGTSACIGSFDKAVKRFYAMATVGRYTGKDSATEQMVGSFNTPVPSDGKVFRAKIKYADLGVKPGQTLRIVAREASAGLDLEAFFPDVLLTLK
jgi:hypothetical protein